MKSPKEIDTIIGRNLRRMRELRGLNQIDLGKALGIGFAQVQKYEAARSELTVSKIVILAGILDCAIDDFFAGVEDGDRSARILARASMQAVRVATNFDKIAAADQRNALAILVARMAKEQPDMPEQVAAPEGERV
jgi:transcriptional regulator with XRE-family HTH domain